MPELSSGNSQVLDVVRNTRAAVVGPDVVWQTGAAKAFQFVAQAAAMAVQDATDNLRNVSTISTTAIGMAMAQLMSTGDAQTWWPVIEAAQGLVKSSAADFQKIGENAAVVLKNFPPGTDAKSAGQDQKPS
jgi:hypothetical protein